MANRLRKKIHSIWDPSLVDHLFLKPSVPPSISLTTYEIHTIGMPPWQAQTGPRDHSYHQALCHHLPENTLSGWRYLENSITLEGRKETRNQKLEKKLEAIS